MTRITLYGRPGCHLCDDARRLLDQLAGEGRRLEIVEIDIERDEALFKAFLEKIPVIEVEGRIVSELIPNGDALRATLDTVGT